jgi:hypothetical protein
MREIPFGFGKKYVGVGEIVGPNGNRVNITIVWAQANEQTPPVLVTAYPA